MKPVFLFLSYCKRYRLFILGCVLMEIIFAIVSLATPEVLRMTTSAIENASVAQLKNSAFFAIITTALYIALTSTVKVMEQHTLNKCEQCVQSIMIDKLFSLRKLQIKQYNSGALVTLITQNATNVVSNSLSFLFQFIQGLAVIIIGIVYMGMLNIKLMVAMIIFNILIRTFFIYFERKIKTSSKIVSNTIRKNNGFLIDLLNNMLVIRVFNRLRYFKNKLFEKETETMMADWKNFIWYNGFSEVVWFTQKAAQIGIAFGFGGYLVFRKETNFSVILAFTVAIDLFTKGINAVMSGLADKSNALPNIEMVADFLNDKAVENKSLNNNHSVENFSIKFDNVSFSFGEKEVLKDVSFEIKPKEKVMIEGPNGEGKSTLLNLILGLYRPKRGKIYYGNCDISQMNMEDIIKNYSFISQNSYITVGNAYENIALSDNYDERELDSIFKKLNLNCVQKNDPQSYSQGEKQRLNIARALLKSVNAKLIVGDEIFSNIDKDNKKKIADVLSSQFLDKTVVMVCHDDMGLKFDKKFVVANKTVQQISL
ncbi:MAG: ABC transporter ATP-binding protein [Clostridiales bacterium]|nr:ABC transporter ATP-binding protein [Clostridiales bacterium]